MTTLTPTPASQLKVGDRVCGDYGVTYTVTHVETTDSGVSVTWHNGHTTHGSGGRLFSLETS